MSSEQKSFKQVWNEMNTPTKIGMGSIYLLFLIVFILMIIVMIGTKDDSREVRVIEMNRPWNEKSTIYKIVHVLTQFLMYLFGIIIFIIILFILTH